MLTSIKNDFTPFYFVLSYVSHYERVGLVTVEGFGAVAKVSSVCYCPSVCRYDSCASLLC